MDRDKGPNFNKSKIDAPGSRQRHPKTILT
jgi:hypothetical protein